MSFSYISSRCILRHSVYFDVINKKTAALFASCTKAAALSAQVDNEKVATETEAYQKIPQILSFVNEQGEDKMKQEIESNYKQIKSDILNVVKNEIERIKNDPNLQHLVQ